MLTSRSYGGKNWPAAMAGARARDIFSRSPIGKQCLQLLGVNPQNCLTSKGLLEIVKADLASETVLSQHPTEVTHEVGAVKGLYHPVVIGEQNEHWTIKPHDTLHLKHEFFDDLPHARKNLYYPARIWSPNHLLPSKPLSKAISRCYPNHESHVKIVKDYLLDLYETGVLYKRESSHSWAVAPKVPLFEWEKHHVIKTKAYIRNRVNGHVFLVDKNSNDSERCRLVVDLSGHSRALKCIHSKYPKYFSPNIHHLQYLIPKGMYKIGLDLASAFYNIPVHPDSAVHLKISDGHTVYGFRKTPMGHGISPFLLQMFTADIAVYIRKSFGVGCLTYMDDFVLYHKHAGVLSRVARTVCTRFANWGVVLNLDKSTPHPVKECMFMGVLLSYSDIRVAPKHAAKISQLLVLFKPNLAYDFKLLQKLLGSLNWLAPFTYLQLAPLRRLYYAAGRGHATSISLLEWDLICLNYSRYKALPYISHVARPTVAVDAASFLSVVSRHDVLACVPAPAVPQAHREMLAFLQGLCFSKCILVDNKALYYKRFSTYPLLTQCILRLLSADALVYWCRSSFMPADSSSRGSSAVTPWPHPSLWVGPRTRLHKHMLRLLRAQPIRAKLYHMIRFA